MVMLSSQRRAKQRGALMVELLVATGLLLAALLPLAYSITAEKRYARTLYQRAVAMQLVDGELEVLAAGQWRAFSNGTTVYALQGRAATNLPPGQFLLTLEPPHLKLEWHPAQKDHGGPVVHERLLSAHSAPGGVP
jgi:hypothetical protein